MSEITDDNMRRETDSGALYAYCFGVTIAIMRNLDEGLWDVPRAVKRFREVQSDLQARLRELAAEIKLDSELQLARFGNTLPAQQASAMTAIFVSDEKGDEHTGE